MNVPLIIGTAVAITSTVIGILLTQSDVAIGPGIKLALVCINAGLAVFALRFNLNPKDE